MSFNPVKNYLCDPYGTGFSGKDFKRTHKFRALLFSEKDTPDVRTVGSYLWACAFRIHEK